jgi:hypothetical protein
VGEYTRHPDIPRKELFERTIVLTESQCRDLLCQLIGWMGDDPTFLRGWSVLLPHVERVGSL